MSTFPTFLIIGAQKAGTSSLYQYTREHPEVYMSDVKEPEFFALKGRDVNHRGPIGCTPNENDRQYTDLDTYQQLFDDVGEETAVGEASTLYLYSPKAPERIHHYIPEAKLIVILRDPVERAYSAFLMAKRSGDEPLSFNDALSVEEERIENGYGYLWRYKDFGRYYEQLQRYLEYFDRDQLQIFLLKDLKKDSHAVMKSIFRFLQVDPSYAPNLGYRHNPGGVPRSTIIQNLLASEGTIARDIVKKILPEKVRRWTRHTLQESNLHKPPLNHAVRHRLTDEFRDDILKLQDLIGRDLSHWLEGPEERETQT